MNKNDVLNTLEYWHSQEFFLPQSLESPKKINKPYKSETSISGNAQEVLLWMNKQRLIKPSNGDYWQFTLYGGIYKIEKIREKLLEIFKTTEDETEERPQTGVAASFALGLDRDLKIKAEELQISTAPWAMEKIKNGKVDLNYEEFKELLEPLQGKISEIVSVNPISDVIIKELNKNILSKIGADFLYDQEIFQVIAIEKKASPSDADKDNIDMLNSFYIDDLKKSIDFYKAGKDSNLLNQYLIMEEADTLELRVDVRGEMEHVYNMLSPENIPDACWPAVEHHPLVFSQQFSINSILKRLKNESGIYAVNGPPGTGKTTMLRDLIATIITERAKVIASYDSYDALFTTKTGKNIWKTDTWQHRYYPIKNELFGFEVVVASSNNGAVENVTLEIPTKKSIDESWLEGIDFFQQYGESLIGEKAWGSGAACLGNSKNKRNFISKFWYNQKDKEGNVTFLGFQEYLQEIAKTSKDIRNEEWQIAKKQFLDALTEVNDLKQDKLAIKEQPIIIQRDLNKIQQESLLVIKKIDELAYSIKGLEDTIQKKAEEHKAYQRTIDSTQKIIDQLCINVENHSKELTVHQVKINSHKTKKPSVFELLLDLLLSFGKRSKQWNEILMNLEMEEVAIESVIKMVQNNHKDKKSELSHANTSLETLKQEIVFAQQQMNKLNATIDSMKQGLEILESKYQQKEKDLVIANDIRIKAEQRKTTDEEREQSSPWMDITFHNARAKVFVEALHLHKKFIHANAEKIKTNLAALIYVLQGNVKQDSKYTEAVRHIWSTLFICIPVVSTTFASFSRLFSHFWDHEIGWLLIDEAGQAPAQAAVGAIMRSKRCIIVGDPLQLEPIISLPISVQDILRKQANAHKNSLSQDISVQKRADFTEINGTYLEDNEGEKTWVGSPLRVHRRCHSPMFEISNTTTYSNMMVHGKKGDECPLPPSQWIDVTSTSANGHWIDEEGQEVMKRVRELRNSGVGEKDIYIISPFRDVVNGLKEIFKNSNLVNKNQIGTIHTVQGKEAKVVILVLGSNPESEGARIWAASKPNLLNVAVTRAKDRLYIIGNKSKWKDKKYFKDAIALLAKWQ